MRIFTHSDTIHKFGRNTDSDSGDDVWDGSNAYPFPSAAAETTIVSGSTDDDAAGTGARTVEVQGLDSDWAHVAETATMDGQNAVTLSTQFLRVYRAKVMTAGTDETNAGNIQIKHGSTVLAQITADMGQTLMAIYTIPADHYGWLAGWRASSDGNGAAKIAFQAKANGGAWQTKDIILMDNVGNSSFMIEYPTAIQYDPKTDFRVRVLTGANNMDIVAQFDMLLHDGKVLPME